MIPDKPVSKPITEKWWKRSFTPGSTYSTGGYTIREINDEDKKLDSWSWDDDIVFGYKRKYKSSIGWDKDRLSTISYSSWTSSYSRSSSTLSESEKILTCAYKSLRDMIVILNFPFKVDIKISNENMHKYYHTLDTASDRKIARIFVPTDILDNSGYDEQAKMDIFCGLGLHEAAHLKFTVSRVIRFVSEELIKIPEIKKRKTRERFVKSLINLIEDFRVEDKLLSERPGFSTFIERSRGYSYSCFVSKTKSSDCKFERYLNNLFKIVRWPDKLEESALEEFSDSYKRIKDILFPLPETTKDSVTKGLDVLNEIFRYFDEISLTSSGGAPIGDLDSYLDQASKEISGSMFTVMYGADGDCGSKVDDSFIAKDVINSGHLFEDLFSGKVEKGFNKRVYIKSEAGDRNDYNLIARRISKYIPGIRKLIKGADKNFEFSIYGCRSGLLDTNKLAEAYQGVPQVYIRKGYVKTNKSTVCVLIDESGSMRSGDKDRKAKEAAILLNEALGSMNGVDLYIYGHTADLSEHGGCGSTTILKYREGSNKLDSLKYSLTNVSGKWENRDGLAILETAKRVRKFTQSPCLMFILSDGEPCASDYCGYSAKYDVKRKVEEVEKMGFTVIQVCIDTVRGAKEMFNNVVDLRNNVANLPKCLSSLIKRLVIKDKKTEIS